MEIKSKGQRMRISSGNTPAAAVQRSADVAPAEGLNEAAAGSGADVKLQSAVLQPALAALRAMPDVDHERVALLRDALAKGELPFDAGKLADLVQRFHGGES